MFRNYLKISLRVLLRYKGFSVINILGLSASMTFCLVLILLIQDQKQIDLHHTNADRIFRVVTEVDIEQVGVVPVASSPGPLGEHLRSEYSGIDASLRLRRLNVQLSNDRTTLPVQGFYAEPSFFDLFDTVWISGNPETALSAPFSIILTEETALTYFGQTNPVGQTLRWDETDDFTVMGVVSNPEYRSHLQFGALASFSTLRILETRASGSTSLDQWNEAMGYYTYLLLKPGLDKSDLDAHLAPLVHQSDVRRKNDRSQTIEAFRLQALADINLGQDLSNEPGRVMSVHVAYILSILALFIMLTACFNYVGLTIARSVKRAREVGIRKVSGAYRSHLIQQFLGESVIIALASLCVSYGLLYWFIPVFNQFGFVQEMGAELSLSFFQYTSIHLYFICFAIGIGLLAGFYPALYLSSFLPIRVLKGISVARGFSRISLRKALIVTQFALAFIFITTPITLFQQINYMAQADYGFDRAHLISIELQGISPAQLQQRLSSHPGITDVTMVSGSPVGGQSWSRARVPSQLEPFLIGDLSVDVHFIANMDLNLLAGRSFDAALSTDEQAIILNETAIGLLGFESPDAALNEEVVLENQGRCTVIGVVEDFYFRPLYQKLSPLALRFVPERFRFALVRFRPDALPAVMAYIRTEWNQFEQVPPLQYTFIDDQIAAEYAMMHDTTRMLGMAAGFLILIACLGLLGMATFSMESRVNEVGIRKVLGAGVFGLTMLLSKETIRLVLMGLAIASPLAWLLNNLLLQDFSARISIDPFIFIGSALFIMSLALLLIGSQTVRTALTNPVQTLRHE